MKRLLLPLLLLFATTLHAESSLIDVLQYRATLRFHISESRIAGDAEITLRNAARGALENFVLDMTSMTIHAVEISGSTVSYTYDDVQLTVTPDAPIPTGDTLTVRIVYEATPGNEGGVLPWGGCHWGDVTYFMGVGFTAKSVSLMRYWLPSNDIPSDKAGFDVTFEVPEDLVVAGTGLLTEQSSADGWASYRWVEQHPTATYLFTYAISDYALVEDDWQGIPMQYFVPSADSARAHQYFAPVASMMDAFTQRFGPYPFDKVGYCITPIGSMEHQTMISYAAQLWNGLSEAGSTAAHELAHMWWGDMVTCRGFEDAWLNEGFAVFSEMVYAEHMGGEEAYYESLRETSQRYRINDTRSEGVFPLHDFPRARPSSNYPATIYHKGGTVLGMLRYVMGDEAFFDGMRTYGATYAYDNATTADYQAVMESEHGASLDWFFDQWVYEAGWPDYIVQRVLDDGDDPLRLRFIQRQDTTQYSLFAMPLDVMIVTMDDDTVRHQIETQAVSWQEFSFPDVASNTAKNFYIDPRGIVLKRISYRTVGVENTPAAPQGVRLDPGYPNPWRPARDGMLALTLHAQSPRYARVTMHDLLGRTVAVLHDGEAPTGSSVLRFDGSRLARGMYTVMLRSASAVMSQHIVVQ